MKKKLAKMIGALLFISMILTTVFPLSAFAADDGASDSDVTVTLSEEDGNKQTDAEPAADPLVTLEPAAGTTSDAAVVTVPAADETVTPEADNKDENGTTPIVGASEGVTVVGENTTDPTETDLVVVTDPEEKKENAVETDSLDNDEKEVNPDEVQNEELDASEKKVSLTKGATRAGSDAGEKKGEDETDAKDSDDTAAPAISVTFPADLTEAGIQVYKTGTTNTFKMFVLESSKMFSPDNETLYIHVETKNESYDKIYFGSKDDAVKNGYIQGAPKSDVGWVFEFALPISAAGTTKGIILGKTDGSWYTNTALEMSIPEYKQPEPEEPKEEAAPAISVSFPADLTEAGIQVYKTGTTNTFKMFVLESSKMFSPDNETLYIHVETKNESYDKIYFGSKDDAVKNGYIQGAPKSDVGWVFEFALPISAAGTTKGIILGKTDGSWYTNTALEMSIPEYKQPEPEEPEKPTIEDGEYTAKTTTDSSMFNIVSAKLIVQNGSMTAEITLSGTGYDYLYAGTAEEAGSATDAQKISYTTNEEGKFVFTIPVAALDEALPFAAHSKKYDKWYDRTITFDSSSLQKIEPETPTIEDGEYTAKTTTDSSMFNIVSAKLIVENGSMTAEITLSGPGYDYLYAGTAEEAGSATDAQKISYTTNEEGKYVFTIPVAALDEALPFAAHSKKYDKWYDRTITFDSSSLKKIEGDEPTPEPEPEPEKPNTPQEESQHETDLSGATAIVDNSTTLPDGVYTPDSFTFSGGSGRATIICTQVTVTNGQAYATIAFDSPFYAYVKANGNTYYPTIVNGMSMFTIPVALNQNNMIIGLTTAMSSPHEIKYTIFVYIAAAEGQEALDNTGVIGKENKLDETAPFIVGLGEGEEIKLETAELMKLFRYSKGITLVEIDRTKDTVLDPEKLAKETDETKKDKAVQSEAAIEDEEGTQSDVKTDADYLMELYQADVVKYLVVPENVELPAGLEKKAIIIRLPKETVYVSSEDGFAEMDSLGLLDLVKAVGIKEEDCKNEPLKKLLEDKKVVSTGSMTDLNYTELVKTEADLVIGAGAEILPKEVEKNKTSKDYQEQYSKISERMALLDIPMLIDRSADEKDPKGQLEWLKLYGILFGKEDEADALIAKGIQ